MPTILAIDDDRSTLHLITKIFEEGDIHVQTAGTAARALELIAAKVPTSSCST